MEKYILILGGGQLAMMLAHARNKLNLEHKILVWEKTRDCSANTIDGVTVIECSDYNDTQTLTKAINQRHIVCAIPEFENVPFETATFLEKNNIPVCPSSNLLKISQHRYLEKTFLNEFVETTPFIHIPNVQQSLTVLTDLGDQQKIFPALLKTNRFGYDGKGQWLIDNIDQLKNTLTDALFSRHSDGFLLEKKADIDKEVSVIIARDREGNTITLPISENHHDQGILRWSIAPAELSAAQQEKIESVSKTLAATHQIQGLFTIELFITKDGKILVNEIAPRVHNSGHHTIEFLNYSQFDLALLSAISNIQSIHIKPQAPYAAMINLLGLSDEISIQDHDKLIKDINHQGRGSLWNYHKKQVKRSRKMGHITALSNTLSEIMAIKDYILNAYDNNKCLF
jgi:5-(carboxyamino)imidazole ribonucleotide synthase